ncbi:MAG: hypothetical protein Q8S00_32595 [Deltaproteobacteria bacterium]|nr:hypothetical protein [Deltaproteobacteria bacterium]
MSSNYITNPVPVTVGCTACAGETTRAVIGLPLMFGVFFLFWLYKK